MGFMPPSLCHCESLKKININHYYTEKRETETVSSTRLTVRWRQAFCLWEERTNSKSKEGPAANKSTTELQQETGH